MEVGLELRVALPLAYDCQTPAEELVEDDRADPLYRIFLDSTAMQTTLRTTIIKHSSGKHSGDFLEECLRCLNECVLRHPSPQDLRGHLPLIELVDAWETSAAGDTREGPADSKGLGPRREVTTGKACDLSRFRSAAGFNRARGHVQGLAHALPPTTYMFIFVAPTAYQLGGRCLGFWKWFPEMTPSPSSRRATLGRPTLGSKRLIRGQHRP